MANCLPSLFVEGLLNGPAISVVSGTRCFASFLQELLAAVDSRPWKSLAKRRVQHYGYEFLYEVSLIL